MRGIQFSLCQAMGQASAVGERVNSGLDRLLGSFVSNTTLMMLGNGSSWLLDNKAWPVGQQVQPGLSRQLGSLTKGSRLVHESM